LWPNFNELARYSPGVTEENHENIKYSRYPGRDLKPRLPEYEEEMLTTGPRRPVSTRVEINNIFTALILNAVTLNCAYRVHLWTSYNSQNKQRLFP
jgi:hypothetical protein